MAMNSLLSADCDGLGYYYGFIEGDNRQINVRYEDVDFKEGVWAVYVGGERVAIGPTKEIAETKAIAWARANPE